MNITSFWTFFWILLPLLAFAHAQSPKYCAGLPLHVCRGNDVVNNVTCIWERISPPKDNSECEKLSLRGNSNEDLGTIEIKPFDHGTDNTAYFTAFNVTFSEIKWTRASLRYTYNDSGKARAFCRKFNMDGKVLLGKELFFDCNFFNGAKDNKILKLEVLLERGTQKSLKKFVLKIQPRDTLEVKENNSGDIETWHVFSYVDISSEKTKIVNIGYYNKFGPMKFKVTANGIGDKLEKITDLVTGPTSVKFQPSELHLPVEFIIEPLCETKCHIVTTPVIDNEPPSYAFLIFSVIPFLLVLALLAFLVLVFLPTKRKYQLIGIPKPTVLIMYKANHDFHSALVEHMAKFLSTKNMDVLLDAHEIPKLNEPDPSRWVSKAVVEADVILIVSSPSCCPTRNDGIYGRQLYDLIEREIRNNSTKKMCRLIRVLLPYCSKSDFPDAMNYPIFSISQDMTKLINFVHRLNNSVCKLVLPFTAREKKDLIEFNRKIYLCQQRMESHDVQDESGSMTGLDLTKDLSPDECSVGDKSVETLSTVVKEDNQYPNFLSINMNGIEDDEETACLTSRPDIEKMPRL